MPWAASPVPTPCLWGSGLYLSSVQGCLSLSQLCVGVVVFKALLLFPCLPVDTADPNTDQLMSWLDFGPAPSPGSCLVTVSSPPCSLAGVVGWALAVMLWLWCSALLHPGEAPCSPGSCWPFAVPYQVLSESGSMFVPELESRLSVKHTW